MNRTIFVPINKVDIEQRMVWGYASTTDLDRQGDRITLEAMRGALPEYMKFPTVREMHQPSAVGRTISAAVDDVGLYIGAKIVDEAAWQKVKEEVYTAFSIKGSGVKQGEWVTKMSIVEISLVDSPANVNARISLWKSNGSPNPKENGTMNLKKWGGPENGSEEDVQKILDASIEKVRGENKAVVEERDQLKKQLAELKTTASEAIALQAKVEELTEQITKRDAEDKDARMKKLLDGAIQAGKFEAKDRAEWEKLFKADEKSTEKILKNAPAVVPMGDRVGVGGADDKTLDEQCDEIITKIAKDDNVSYDVASDRARKRNPQLFAKREAAQLQKSQGVGVGTLGGGSDE